MDYGFSIGIGDVQPSHSLTAGKALTLTLTLNAHPHPYPHPSPNPNPNPSPEQVEARLEAVLTMAILYYL